MTGPSQPAPARLTLSSPADVLGAIPFLLGYDPAADESLVVLCLQGRRVLLTCRLDLPDTAAAAVVDAARVAELLTAQGTTDAVIVGYGPGNRVTPLALELSQRLAEHGVLVKDVLRAEAGRFFSYTCRDLTCCPPDGVPYKGQTDRIAAEAAYAGLVALPSRATLEDQLTPVSATSARAATDRAAERLLLAFGGDDVDPEAVFRHAQETIGAAIERHARGEPLTHDEVAELTLLLMAEEMRDAAALASRERPAREQSALWLQITRRAVPSLATAPACLLAMAAWRSGDGALASIAIERALTVNSDDQLANVIRDQLDRGLPPSYLDAALASVQAPPASGPRTGHAARSAKAFPPAGAIAQEAPTGALTEPDPARLADRNGRAAR
jgi:hypothetical protein